MCPACIATAVWIAAGATTTTGVGAILAKRLLRSKSGATESVAAEFGKKLDPNTKPKETK